MVYDSVSPADMARHAMTKSSAYIRAEAEVCARVDPAVVVRLGLLECARELADINDRIMRDVVRDTAHMDIVAPNDRNRIADVQTLARVSQEWSQTIEAEIS